MRREVYANLGRRSASVAVGPGAGLDNAVVSLGGGRVMVITTDPVSLIPEMGPELSAWLSVHLIASDLATSGVPPQFASMSYNFPDYVSEAECGRYLRGIGAACDEMGVSVVAGHTGTYPGAGLTVVGGGSMIGVAGENQYVTPAMSRVGDAILITKSAGLEAAASLAWSFPKATAERVGRKKAALAKSLIRSCSTVADAKSATRAGLRESGVTSMHDATEGGVLGALAEMANASHKKLVVDLTEIPVYEEVQAVCDAFDLDPLRSISEGTLLMTCGGAHVNAVRGELRRDGISSSLIGKVESGVPGL